MKEFRKSKIGYFICEECGKECETFSGFSQHVGKLHDKQKYYDKWIKDINEGNCKICGNKTNFSNKFNIGYKSFCSKKCANKSTRIGFEKGMIKKYGTIIPMQHEKSRAKYVKTMMHNHGVEVPSKNKQISDKMLKTMNKRYGHNAPMQNSEVFKKSFKNRIKIYTYKDTDLFYQGSYELHFLENFANKINIINGPRIKYTTFNGTKRIYYSDFLMPSLNMIVEVKSSYILTLDDDILEKKIATIKEGYDYILILDKNYSELINILEKHGISI